MKKFGIGLSLLVVLLLAACTTARQNSTDVADSSAQNGAVEMTGDVLKDAIGKKLNYSDIEIVSVTNAGNHFILVDYNIPISTNRFALCNTQTGAIELLPVYDVELIEIKSENYFVFENRGEYTDSAFRFIPTIWHCFRIASDENGENFTTIQENELFELDRTLQFGSKNTGMLAAITTSLDGFDIVFKPSSADDNFYTPAPDVPKTKTVYNAATNQLSFEFSISDVSDQIKYDTEYKTENNLYINSYKVHVRNDKTEVILSLKDSAKRYTVERKFGPQGKNSDESFPYITVAFTNATS